MFAVKTSILIHNDYKTQFASVQYFELLSNTFQHAYTTLIVSDKYLKYSDMIQFTPVKQFEIQYNLHDSV